VDVTDGWSLMQGATANGVDGIVGECGGSCACATCHCYVDETRMADLPPPSEGELDMLDNVAAERRPNSRLACQIKASAALEGLVVTCPRLRNEPPRRTPRIVIVGAGQAGVQAAEALRAAALHGAITCWATSPTAPTTARRCPRPGWPARWTPPSWRCARPMCWRAKRASPCAPA
jgi:2Fe-2S ferredoxin